jgi:hypothetical protein
LNIKKIRLFKKRNPGFSFLLRFDFQRVYIPFDAPLNVAAVSKRLAEAPGLPAAALTEADTALLTGLAQLASRCLSVYS